MKNIQVVDAAKNCTYEIFEASDDDFEQIFPDGQDVEFIDDFVERVGQSAADQICERLWTSRQAKPQVRGIHGTLFFGLEYKKSYYPTKRESEMVVVID